MKYLKALYWRLKTLVAPPKWKLKEEHRIISAFTAAGVDYFKFEDINNLMAGRAFAAIDFFNELQMKCDRNYLIAHTKAMNEIMQSKEVNIGKIYKLNEQLRERLEMIIDPEIVLKIASVVYFDNTEQPYNYDFKYGYEKIRKWRGAGVDDFFFKTQLKDLLPGLTLSESDFLTYTKVAKEMNKEHLGGIFTMLSTKYEKEEWYKVLKSQNIMA